MFIKSEKYSVLQAACGVPVYFTKLKPVEEKIADVTSASRSNRVSNVQITAITEIPSSGQSILIKPLTQQIEGLTTIDTSFIGTHKISTINFAGGTASVSYYQNLPDIISTNISAEVYAIPNIDVANNYLIEFYVESLVPSSAEAILRPSKYVVSGNESFVPTTTIEIRSKFSTSAKALVKMLIRDALTNKILRYEYMEIVVTDYENKPCEIITEKPIENIYVSLDKTNNWTYNHQGYTLAQFIPYNKNIETSIQIIKKNNQLLPNRGDKNRFKIVVDPIKLSNKKVTIDQIRTAVLQQFNTIQNYSIIANTVNKSYDIILKDVFLQSQDLNDLVVATVPPVTGIQIKLSDVAEAIDDGVISDRSEIPGVSLLRWNNNYIGELHFDKNIYLNDPLLIKYGIYNLSGIINNFYFGLNSLTPVVTNTPTPTKAPTLTPTSTLTPTPTPQIMGDDLYACDFWDSFFNGLYSLSSTDINNNGVYTHNILDINEEDTGINTVLSYDSSINRWIIAYCASDENPANCFPASFKSSTQSVFSNWIKTSEAPSHYEAGTVGSVICGGLPTSTPTSTPMPQAPTPTPTQTLAPVLAPTGFNVTCGACPPTGSPQIVSVNLSWFYNPINIPDSVEIHELNVQSEIISIISLPSASGSINIELEPNTPTLFKIRSVLDQRYSDWAFYPYVFTFDACCPTTTPTPTASSTPGVSTSTPTSTPTRTPTSTPVPPTSTQTSTPVSPTSTPTRTPTSTPTPVNLIQYVDYTIESYSCPTANTINTTVPSSVQSGDMIVALLMRRSSITDSSSFTLLDEIANPSTSTGQVTSVYTKIADSDDASSSVTFTQSGNGRMGISLLVLRSTNNNFNIESIVKNSSDTDIPVLPEIASSGSGRMAVAFMTNTFSNVGFPPCDLQNTIYPPQGYQGFTNESLCSYSDGETTPECQQLRLAAAYKAVNSTGNIHQNSETFLTNITDRRIAQISFIVSPV